MNQPKSAKSAVSYFTWIVLFGILGVATAGCIASKQGGSATTSYGSIHFNNDKGEEKCVLPIPEIENTWDFTSSASPCENNMVSTFWLENVPSATLIDLHDSRNCSELEIYNSFYFKLRTVKQPTDWAPGGSVTHSVDALRNVQEGELIPKKNTRLEKKFIGADYDNKNLNERLSCVHIERSQPVK